MSKLYADEGRETTGDEQRVARGEQMATYHRGLKINTTGVASLAPVHPDPPIPEPEE